MADFLKMPVSVHCHGTDGIKMFFVAMAFVPLSIPTILDDECLRMYKASNRSFMMPTLSAPH